MTNAIEASALELIQKIADKSGAQKAIEAGFYRGIIRRAAGEYQKEIEKGERVIVGLNRFVDDKHKMKIESFKADEGVQERVIQKLRGLKSNRDHEKVRRCLGALEQDARVGKNTVPAVTDCARAYATIGEMCQVLGNVWGTYKEGASWL